MTLVAALAGCTDQAEEPETAPTTSAAAATTPTTPTTPTPPPPPQPVTTVAPCPYLDQGYVEQTVGQKVGTVEVTTTEPPVTPLPGCTFYALNDEPAVAVVTEQHPSPVEAQTAALAKVGEAGNPVTTVADGGAVLAANGQTICAVSKGTAVVVITINQESSLEGEEIAGTVADLIP